MRQKFYSVFFNDFWSISWRILVILHNHRVAKIVLSRKTSFLKFFPESRYFIRVHRQANFAQKSILCFQNLELHDHTFNRAKLANYVISPGFHGQVFHGQAQNLSCPGIHDKQQNPNPLPKVFSTPFLIL